VNFRSFDTLDAVQTAVLQDLLESGSEASPRGMTTHEIVAGGFTLINPRSRIILNSARRWSLPLAIGEFAWHVSGSDHVAPIAYYAPVWRTFSEDGSHIRGSCYGKRIFDRNSGEPSQWDRIIELLRTDPASRRAVLSIRQSEAEALEPSSLDVPCVTTCQFFVREGHLDAVLHMRSNDAIWGLPYDVFLFTMLQEMLALELGVALGRYHHFAGSLHLYERHFELARKIISTPSAGGEMSPMLGLDQLPEFIEAERELRTTGGYTQKLLPYWASLLEPIAAMVARRAA